MDGSLDQCGELVHINVDLHVAVTLPLSLAVINAGGLLEHRGGVAVGGHYAGEVIHLE